MRGGITNMTAAKVAIPLAVLRAIAPSPSAERPASAGTPRRRSRRGERRRVRTRSEWVGRRGSPGGRWLLRRPGPFARQRAHVLESGEPFFARHGPKAVFLGRWILGLRTWASWLAGASRMPWRSFALWNAAGGIGWAATVGLAAYFAGRSAAGTLALFGVAGLLGAPVLPAAVIARRGSRQHGAPASRERREPPADPEAPAPA